jgi:esterase/lipase
MEPWELAGGTAGGGVVAILLHRLLTIAENYVKNKKAEPEQEDRHGLVVLAEISRELTKVATILENIHEEQQKIAADVLEIKMVQDKQVAIEKDRRVRAV